jgi:hypothetical protein
MRIRQVKPDFWRDERLGDLSDTARLVYIGLWMEADDAGWFRENTTEIAAELFPFQSRATRERKVTAALEGLLALGRIVSHPCGHSFIPRMTEHQRFSSPDKRVYTVARQHEKCATPVTPAGTRGSPRFPATVGNKELVGNKVDIGEPIPPGFSEGAPLSASGSTR